MREARFRQFVATLSVLTLCLSLQKPLGAGTSAGPTRYRVLAPITQGNLTIFPVLASNSFDTHNFITLDEGLRSGEVIVTESGGIQPLVRHRRPDTRLPMQTAGAQVNQLVLVNNSSHPLILLAGEIVTGGKQDRIVGKDRIVPGQSDTDLAVFCVEHGRWTEVSKNFAPSPVPQMATPKIRTQAMAAQNQQGVWDAVSESNRKIASSPSVAGRGGSGESVSVEVHSTTSYARVMGNEGVRKEMDAVVAPMQRSYERMMHDLHNERAIGVVVAVNGEIVWADLFASSALLEKYWPKLIRSYAAEAMTDHTASRIPAEDQALAFVERIEGTREIIENEPGVYRHSEISGAGFKLFSLVSLLPSTGFDLHISKMTTER